MNVEEIRDFYRHAVFAIYGIVIGLSFEIAGKVMILIQKITSYNAAVNTAILVLAYFIR